MAHLRRIVCYAVNGSGLGHVTRLLAVGRWLRRFGAVLEGREPEVLFLTSTEATHVLLSAGFAAFKVPSKTVVKDAGMDPLEYRRLARQFVWQTLGTFKPDLLVVDTFPSGSFDELFQLLDGPYAKAFILRNVKPAYAANPVFQAAMRLYDVVIAPHPAERVEPVRVPPGVTVRHTDGEVLQVEPQDLLAAAEVRASLGIPPEQRLIYVSAGGGGDRGSEEALSTVIAALGEDPALHLLVGAGPLYRGRRRGGPRLTWFTEPRVATLFGACDAAVSAAGYNTFHELLLARVPTVFYAQDKIADDQARRVRLAQEAGACLSVEGPPQAQALRAALGQALDPERARQLRAAAAAHVPRNGARRCASLVLSPLYSEARRQRAERLLEPDFVHRLEALPDRGIAALTKGLTSLLPAGRLDAIDALPALDALLARVSEAAAAEVRGALEDAPDARVIRDVQRGLADLLEAAQGVGIDPQRALATLSAAQGKHPLSQERDGDWRPWVVALLAGVREVVTLQAGALSHDDVLRLYRIAPRLVDVDAATALRALTAALRRMAEAGAAAHVIEARLRALKAAHVRVTAALLDQACGA